ncbi:hypothetical protein ABZN20_12125 [Methylococcus sp. ANG]|uniref:hypothetical protein n=1 Tax=Methylococcus sp. ANG TaxID=3231903 RepID=UPI00345AA423
MSIKNRIAKLEAKRRGICTEFDRARLVLEGIRDDPPEPGAVMLSSGDDIETWQLDGRRIRVKALRIRFVKPEPMPG